MLLINCEINLIPTCPAKLCICEADRATSFAITDTKLYVPLVTLSTQDNTKILQKLKSRFKYTINWKEYQSKVSTQAKNQYLHYFIDPSFQGMNRHFFIVDRTGHTGYFLPKVKIKDYIVMIDGRNFF